MSEESIEHLLRNINEELKLYKTPETRIIFADAMHMLITSDEMKLIFGNRDIDEPQNAAITDIVILTPPRLKRLASRLNEAVVAYEQSFGPIDSSTK
ncbi:MAG: hypothetical protein P4L33_13630 [Capsulimonadaceae bacterium]|nr:hypothetical protein [Capsulimonadaceae bacterium]